MITSFLHSEILETPCMIFQRYHPGNLNVFSMQNPKIISFLGCELKSEATEVFFITENLDFCHSYEKM